MKAAGGSMIQELATLLARGYLRLLTGSRPAPTIAPILGRQDSPAGSPNCLDVAARAKHELEPEGRP